jgi:hypothetical protein
MLNTSLSRASKPAIAGETRHIFGGYAPVRPHYLRSSSIAAASAIAQKRAKRAMKSFTPSFYSSVGWWSSALLVGRLFYYVFLEFLNFYGLLYGLLWWDFFGYFLGAFFDHFLVGF